MSIPSVTQSLTCVSAPLSSIKFPGRDASGVYSITCCSNGKQYIGSSRHIKERRRDHRRLLSKSKHINRELQADWSKLSGEFVFTLVEECGEDALLVREQHHISEKKNSGVSLYNRPRFRHSAIRCLGLAGQQKLLEQFRSGESILSLSWDFKLSDRTVSQVLKANGITAEEILANGRRAQLRTIQQRKAVL